MKKDLGIISPTAAAPPNPTPTAARTRATPVPQPASQKGASRGWECGTGLDGCPGGTLNYGGCGKGRTCNSAHQCVCASGYHKCDGVCIPKSQLCNNDVG
jgi:hypothetical protein